ncbi:MAG TPA: hypothetical protein ENN79_04160, partial [Desulfobacteraceae bacterium]|nr:hypothetical protein [Desulfobacteraceae bacterium]
MKLGLTLVIMAVTLSMVYSALLGRQVFIPDILERPGKYRNQTIEITGRVVDVVKSSGQGDRGYYAVKHFSSGRIIRVAAETLPDLQTEVTLLGLVQLSGSEQGFYIREIMRSNNPRLMDEEHILSGMRCSIR